MASLNSLMYKLLKITVILFPMWVFISGCNKNVSDPKPNIVWILAEDISQDLACYGYEGIQTPVLDELADKGERFLNAFTTSPVCSPSRSAMITGFYQTTTGTHNHRSQIGTLPDSVRLITDYLRDEGYFTCNITDDQFSFATGKTDFNFSHPDPFDGTNWNQRKEGQPFFAQLSIYTTHRDTHWKGIENKTDTPVDPSSVDIPSYYPDHPVTRLDWARYLNSIQVLDSQVGEVIARLKEEGLWENTIVIFSGDHGRCMTRGKQWLYDSGLKIPLIIKWEESMDIPEIDSQLISAIDISATILDAAGVKIPDNMQGRSFYGKKKTGRTEIYAARDRCDGVVDRIRAVRNSKYKYIKNYMPEKPYNQYGHYKAFYYPVWQLMEVLYEEGKLDSVQSLFMVERKPDEELYDIINDPEEINNLAMDPNYQDVLNEMRTKLTRWEITTEDQGSKMESDSFINALLIEREEKYAPLWESRGIPYTAPAKDHLKWWIEDLGADTFNIEE